MNSILARQLAGPALAESLSNSRRRTLALVEDLSDAQWLMPRQPGVNPVAWELAHLAWFAEFWVLRGPHRRGDDGFVHAARPARIAGPDGEFDSARLAHAARWTLALPSRGQLLDRLAMQLEATLAALPASADDEALYFHRLALFHEDMHGEAFAWLRAALGYPAPAVLEPLRAQPGEPAPLRFAASVMQQGWPAAQAGFSFDNESAQRQVALVAFEIDSHLVTAGQFQRFIDSTGEPPPAHWRRAADGGWEQRCFDRWLPLDPVLPMINVNAFEAEAYCRWAGRRLPRACEWEHATGDANFRWGRSVWEWTADAFKPYPGFRAGPYKDYSEPWFDGRHRELRGGAFATHARLHEPRYRNFFMPQRSDVFAGFRTAAG